MKTGRSFARTLAAVAALALAGGTAWAAQGTTGKETTGKVSIESMSVAAGLGYAWGNGVLEYRGAKYPFTVTAFSILDVAVREYLRHAHVEDAERRHRERIFRPTVLEDAVPPGVPQPGGNGHALDRNLPRGLFSRGPLCRPRRAAGEGQGGNSGERSRKRPTGFHDRPPFVPALAYTRLVHDAVNGRSRQSDVRPRGRYGVTSFRRAGNV